MKLSVLILTFNQSTYIARAIESALMQKPDFPWEIVVGDDCSTDGTREIVQRFEHANPGKIRAIYMRRNTGLLANFKAVYAACRGQYVAALEGDDYWTCPDKLQRQVALLDAHDEYSMCFHRATLFDEATNSAYEHYGPTEKKDVYDLEDILVENFVPTCSVVSRNGLLTELPPWISKLRILDWPAHIQCAMRGRLGYIDENMATYTRHAGGLWSAASVEERLDTIRTMYGYVGEDFAHKYDPIIRVAIKRWEAVLPVEAQRDAFERMVVGLSEERRQLLAKIQALSDLAGERVALHDQIQTLTEESAERASLYEQIRDLGEQVAAQGVLHEEIRRLGEQVAGQAALHEEIQRLGREIASQGALHAKIRQLTEESAERAALHEQIGKLSADAAALPALHERIRELANLADERPALYGRIQELTDEGARLRARIDSLEKMLNPL